MSPSAWPREQRYTWTDYPSWPGDERWEIIDGIAYNMSPAPSIRHQTIAGNWFAQLYRHLAGTGCRPFMAPTAVRLSETDVVQPDILVVCDPAKITPSHIDGAPDLVVEILSPGTAAKDPVERYVQRVCSPTEDAMPPVMLDDLTTDHRELLEREPS